MVCSTRVFCTFQVAGFHCWPDAPDWCSYLRNNHRHTFHFRVEALVTNPNRGIEFIQMQAVCVQFTERIGDINVSSLCAKPAGGIPIQPYLGIDFGAMSCEMIAQALYTELIGTYPVTKIEVSEDGENGAVVEFDLPTA